jgi:hypothetical protein
MAHTKDALTELAEAVHARMPSECPDDPLKALCEIAADVAKDWPREKVEEVLRRSNSASVTHD